MKKRILRAGLALAVLIGSQGAAATELIVSAASSLTGAFTELAARFERTHPGVKVLFNFAGSGALVQQVMRGAPVDVMATADLETMDRAAAQKLLLNDTRRVFVRNRLVLVAATASNVKINSLADLLRGDLHRIAVGLPDSVPAGSFAKQALEAAGLWQALYGKFIFTQNVRQGLDYVAREEVDLAFVFHTDVAAPPSRVRKVLDVEVRTPILYPIAVVKGSANEMLARRFVDFTGSPDASQIFEQFGFLRP